MNQFCVGTVIETNVASWTVVAILAVYKYKTIMVWERRPDLGGSGDEQPYHVMVAEDGVVVYADIPEEVVYCSAHSPRHRYAPILKGPIGLLDGYLTVTRRVTKS